MITGKSNNNIVNSVLYIAMINRELLGSEHREFRIHLYSCLI